MKGKTASGFSFEVNEEIGDDMELLEAICELDKGNLAALPDVIVSILGKDQKEKLYDFCRTKSGRVSSVKVLAAVREIFEAINESETDIKN